MSDKIFHKVPTGIYKKINEEYFFDSQQVMYVILNYSDGSYCGFLARVGDILPRVIPTFKLPLLFRMKIKLLKWLYANSLERSRYARN